MDVPDRRVAGAIGAVPSASCAGLKRVVREAPGEKDAVSGAAVQLWDCVRTDDIPAPETAG